MHHKFVIYNGPGVTDLDGKHHDVCVHCWQIEEAHRPPTPLVPSPDTSAQDAPRTPRGNSFRAAARSRGVLSGEEAVEIAFANLLERWTPRPQMNRHEWRALFAEVEAAIRASEWERSAALESVALEIWSHRVDEVRLPPDIQEQLRAALGT